jgi:hypothetical protein
MERRKIQLKKMLIVLCMILLFVPSGFISANETAVESEHDIEIQLFLGDNQISINGEKLTIVKPFVENRTTLVPLRVITESFGAELTWVPETQTVILIYGDKKLELSIGSKNAYVNGEVQVLLTEPKLVKESEVWTTMVPVRFISENFGADVRYTDATKEILITGSLMGSLSDFSGINEDAGKTHFGDSFHHWSMKYPTGLVIDFQDFRGNYNNFIDANGEYELSVSIEENENLTQADLLKEIKEYSLGTVLDQRTIKENGQTYAKLISKNSSGNYMEIRGFIKESTIYYIFFEVTKEEDYKDEAKYKDYQDLLNSFNLSFVPGKEMKDISKVKDGYIQYNNNDYGLSLKLPADWTAPTWTEDLYFANPEKKYYLSVVMSSIIEDETLNQWLNREDIRINNAFVKEFVEIGKLENTTIAGVDAFERTVSTTYGTQWDQIYDVYFIAGNYKFNMLFEYKKEDYDEIKDSIQGILQSIEIDVKHLNESFGYIDDETIYDPDEKRKITSKDYKYSIEFPEYWTTNGVNNDDSNLIYGGRGIQFQLVSSKTLSYLDATNRVDYVLEETKKLSADFRLISTTITTLNGITAKKYVYSGTDEDGDPYQTTSYVLHKSGITYLIDMITMDAARTSINLQHMEEILSSFEMN